MPSPAGRASVYSVTVLEAQYRCLNTQQLAAELAGPQEQEPRQLEGPDAKEAA
jgi:hypothetical protein